jgi:hypothetical protein
MLVTDILEIQETQLPALGYIDAETIDLVSQKKALFCLQVNIIQPSILILQSACTARKKFSIKNTG